MKPINEYYRPPLRSFLDRPVWCVDPDQYDLANTTELYQGQPAKLSKLLEAAVLLGIVIGVLLIAAGVAVAAVYFSMLSKLLEK